jgi:menaquinone-specific isochorismate synthase
MIRNYRKTETEAPQDLSGARWKLAEEISRALSRAEAPHTPAEEIVRVSVPVLGVDPLGWLKAQRAWPKSYWAGRDDGLVVAATGAADVVEGDGVVASLRKHLSLLSDAEDARSRYYGGMRFDPEAKASGEWAAFGSRLFVLPRFELFGDDGRFELACNLVLPRDAERGAEILRAVEELDVVEPVVGGIPSAVSREDEPGWSGWRENVERALAHLREERLGKVVLARRAALRFAGEVDAFGVMAELEEATPGCFHFLFEPEEGVVFLGASPERLFRRAGRAVASEAVAGTRPRSESAVDDEELREELLSSEKDLAEQAYVRISIRESMERLCEELEIEDHAGEMKLARGRHLVSRVRGTLRPGVGDAEVLEALHPTPAVGGYPRAEAFDEIRELEAFDRGWYAGPLGWIGSEGAEFAVGIRSGLVRGSRLALYSGAGIVPGSTPEGEWAEIEHKIGDFLRVFGLDPAARHAAS